MGEMRWPRTKDEWSFVLLGATIANLVLLSIATIFLFLVW